MLLNVVIDSSVVFLERIIIGSDRRPET